MGGAGWPGKTIGRLRDLYCSISCLCSEIFLFHISRTSAKPVIIFERHFDLKSAVFLEYKICLSTI